MKFRFLLVACILAASTTAAQERILIAPNWKVGDARNIHATKQVRQTRNDTLVLDQTLEWKTQISVTRSTSKAFIVELDHWDDTMLEIEGMRKRLGIAGVVEKPLLRYSVDKATGASELQNWEEAKAVLVEEHRLLSSAVKGQGTDAETAVAEFMAPILTMLSTKEAVDDFFSEAIDAIASVYGKSLMQRDTMRIHEAMAMPDLQEFGDSVRTTTLMTISSHDPAKQRLVVRSEMVFDMSEMVKVMKVMFTKIMEATLEKEKDRVLAKRKIAEAVDQIEMSNTNQTLTTLSTRTSWPIKVVSTERTTFTQPGSKVVENQTLTVLLTEQ